MTWAITPVPVLTARRAGRPRVGGCRLARLDDVRLARPRCGINRGYVPSARPGACSQCADDPGSAA